MPVVWHQGLLCFVQRYKHQLRTVDVDALRRLTKAQHHYLVSPEVLRELDQASPRDVPTALGAANNTRVAAAAGSLLGSKPSAAHVGHHVLEDARNLPPVPMNEDD